MRSGIQSVVIRHRIRFFPSPESVDFTQQFVATRRVADIPNFREEVTGISFDDVVESKVWVQDRSDPNQMQSIVVLSEPFDDSGIYEVVRDEEEVNRRLAMPGELWTSIEVHPNLRGKVWVLCYGTQKYRLAA